MALSQSENLQRLDVSFIQNCPSDAEKITDAKGLRDSLPRVSIVAEHKSSAEALRKFVPQGWPKEESLW